MLLLLALFQLGGSWKFGKLGWTNLNSETGRKRGRCSSCSSTESQRGIRGWQEVDGSSYVRRGKWKRNIGIESNNMAGVYGLWQGIKQLKEKGVEEAMVFGDSHLIIQGMNGAS